MSAVEAEVLSVLVAPRRDSLVSEQMPRITLDIGGVVGDRHHGITMTSNSRQSRFYRRGTEIRNRRQVSLVALEEMEEIRLLMGLPELRAEELGANVVVRGMPRLSTLPIGTRLLFDDGAGLVCEGVNQPCVLPARAIQARLGPDIPVQHFVRHAFGRRGIVASVERTGTLRPGEQMRSLAPELHAVH